MKTLLLAFLAVLIGSGCVCPSGMSKLARELAKDPATVSLRVMTPYGSLDFVRANPLTNSIRYSVSPDGRVSVGSP